MEGMATSKHDKSESRKTDRHKQRLMGLRLPPTVEQGMRKLAAKNYRTLTAEILIALENHLKAQQDK